MIQRAEPHRTVHRGVDGDGGGGEGGGGGGDGGGALGGGEHDGAGGGVGEGLFYRVRIYELSLVVVKIIKQLR